MFTITKEEIINSLKNTSNAFRSGSYVQSEYGNNAAVDLTCQVCAVGAVLRDKCRYSFLDGLRVGRFVEMCTDLVRRPNAFLDGNATVTELKKDKDWLSLLSSKYEELMHEYNDDYSRVKPKLISYVRKNFPKSFKTKQITL